MPTSAPEQKLSPVRTEPPQEHRNHSRGNSKLSSSHVHKTGIRKTIEQTSDRRAQFAAESDANSTSVSYPTLAKPPKSLIDLIPVNLVLMLAKPYMAGNSPNEALSIASDLYVSKSFSGTLDILGEDATNDEDCERSVANYMQLMDALCATEIKTNRPKEQLTVSFKPSMFSVMAPRPGKESEKAQEEAFDRIARLVDYASKRKIEVTLEAEDHRWTNFQLESYFALINAGYNNLGTVLQTRLLRTEKDIKRFDERMRVRLVIGIYNEPSAIALTSKPAMKKLLVQYASELFQKNTYVELATHDVGTISSFHKEAVIPQNVDRNRFEHQFLLGVPRSKVQETLVDGSYFTELAKSLSPSDRAFTESLAESGALVRMYLPYGSPSVSGAYCRRRLKENPNMITYGIKNLLHIQ